MSRLTIASNGTACSASWASAAGRGLILIATAYASRLFITAYRSQTARYNRLIEDIRNDVMRIDPFFSSARYVTEMDRKREKALAYVTNLTAEERDNTLQRIAENRNIVRWVQGSLHERTESTGSRWSAW